MSKSSVVIEYVLLHILLTIVFYHRSDMSTTGTPMHSLLSTYIMHDDYRIPA